MRTTIKDKYYQIANQLNSRKIGTEKKKSYYNLLPVSIPSCFYDKNLLNFPINRDFPMVKYKTNS